MIWAVVDTNVLVSGMGWPVGPPGKIIDALLDGRFVLVTSDALLEELERVISYPKLGPVFGRTTTISKLLREIAIVVKPQQGIEVFADEPDNRLLEAAVTALADVIVSGDDDVLALGEDFRGIRLMRPGSFVKLLQEQDR